MILSQADQRRIVRAFSQVDGSKLPVKVYVKYGDKRYRLLVTRELDHKEVLAARAT